MTHPLFNALCHAQDIVRDCTKALALSGVDDIQSEAHTNSAIAALHRLADDLGYVAVEKADHVALTAFVEECRDFRPTIHRDTRNDPADREDDLMPLGEFQAFQIDAADLIPAKAKQGVAA